jgi:hypothetical protein
VLGARLDERPARAALAASTSTAPGATRSPRSCGRAAPSRSRACRRTTSRRRRAAAVALAVRLEEGMALRWRDLVGGTDDVELRRLALSGLQETAVRAATWRELTGAGPVTGGAAGDGLTRRTDARDVRGRADSSDGRRLLGSARARCRAQPGPERGRGVGASPAG